MLFVASVFGFVGGILIGSLYSISLFTILFLSVPGILLFGFSFFNKNKNIQFFAVITLALMLGLLRIHSVTIQPTALNPYLDTKVTLQGVVAGEEDVRESSNRITLSIISISGTEVSKTKVLAVTDRFTHVSYGDEVVVSGTLSKPENFETDSGRVFNYIGYLAKDDVYYLLSFGKIESITAAGFSLRGSLFSLKKWFLGGVQKLLGEPDASLAGGITVGAKQSLGKALLDAFRTVGLIHIVVLSGYNVTIIAEAILRFLKFLPKRTALIIGAVAIALFALLTGAGATIVRASIMAILALIARATGRTYELTRALFLAATLMLIINPRILLFDPSFQLSFIATLGLIYIAPHIEQRISFISERFGLRPIVGATIGTQIAVFPLIIYMTGVFSLIALPANLLVLPMIPFSMLAVFLTGIVGALVPVLGIPIAYIAHLTLAYVIGITEVFAKLPFAAISVPAFPLWTMVMVYSGMIIIFWNARVRQQVQ